MNARTLFAGLALYLVAAPVASADTAIPGGESIKTVLEPASVNNELYVPVPEGATHLEILVEGKRPNVDVDLYLRYAEPFVADSPQTGQLLDGGLYRSVGPNNIEFLDITYASSPPVSPGRWYLGLVNLDPERQTEVTITVAVRSEADPTLEPLQINVVYSDGAGFGFNSGLPFQAQGGNNAGTLGAARKRAFEEAIEILEESFTSPVPITVEARFETIEQDPNGGAPLAFASPTCIARDFPGAPLAGTWYAQAIVPRLAGTDFFRAGFKPPDAGDDEAAAACFRAPEADLRATFNTDPPGAGWWYGLQPSSTIGDGYDFVSVALHEILHGLGYLSLADVETGGLARVSASDRPRSDAFTEQLHVFQQGEPVPVSELTDAQRLEAFTSNGRLYWLGELGDDVFWPAVQARIGQTGNIHPTMYSPGMPNPGSSVSHTFFHDIMYYEGTQAAAANPGVNLRSSGPDLGSAYFFLRDAGWSEEARPLLEGPVGAAVPRGMWYDRSRNGHGFDFQRVGDLWFLVFFTYDDQGNPEWYLAVGALEDNLFSGTLQRFTYDESAPAGSERLTAEDAGTVELAFEATPETPACNDGVNRGDAIALARFSWEIDGGQGDWCAEPLPLAGTPPAPDFTAHWYAGENDTGWGMTIYQRELDDGTRILLDTLYYFDQEGNARWAQGFTGDFLNSHGDQTITMQQFEGFARSETCAGEGCVTGMDAGLIRLRLEPPVQGPEPGSRATTNVDYLGPEGGTWSRNFVPIQMLSDPN